MRKHLFRGKTNRGEWIEGYYIVIADKHYIYSIEDAIYYQVIIDTIGKYTGLTDKTGKKIFEGDIGRYKQTDGAKRNRKPIICTGNIIYNAKTASYAVDSKDENGCKYFDYFPIKDVEVIGNIHDNSELLKGDEGK